MIKVLVITHELSLSGAPKSLLYTFSEIKNNSNSSITFDVLSLKKDAGLENQFKGLSSCIYYFEPKKEALSKRNLIKKVLSRKRVSDAFLSIDEISNYDIIYANTIVSLKLAIQLVKKKKTKLILHIHELNTVLNEFVSNLNDYDSFIDRYIVPSYMNQNCLVDNFNISVDKISVIRETTELVFAEPKTKNNIEKFNVLMCGGAYWRKGDDIFIQVAKLVVDKNPNVNFYWVGYQSDERSRVNQLDIDNLELKNHVFFVGQTNTPNDWLPMMDLFFLSSREDPFPLAAIEAGLYGIPICCFDKATGISEVIQEKELIAPYLDLNKMAEIILTKSHERVDFSERQKEVFKSFNVSNIASQTKELIYSVAKL